MDEDEEVDLSELPLETQEWLRRISAKTGDAPEAVLINCIQIVHDLVDFEPNPNVLRTLDANVMAGIRLALASINSATLPVIDRILATKHLPPLPEDEDQVPLYRVDVSFEEAGSIYGHLLRVVLTRGKNTLFGKFPVRVLMGLWQKSAFGPTP